MGKNPKDVKVCFAASSGGHLEQLLALRPLMERYDSFILTEKTSYKSKFPVNRHEVTFLPRMIANAVISMDCWLSERPDVIVCTGVLATVPFCLIGHALGSKLVYIESFAKTDSPTMTGKHLSKYADRFYVQWETMLSVYPEARFVGGVY